MSKIAIIGAGISGIAAAHFLKRETNQFDIFESSDNFGGRVGSLKMGDKWIDFGGKNIGYGYKLFREFVKEQGEFNYEYFGVNTSKILNGKITKINREKNLKSFLNLFKLATPIDLIKLFYLVKRIKKQPNEGFICSDYYNNLAEKYDHKNIANYFSSKCSENLIRPMTIRMNGAEPEECYIGNFGSNLRIAFDRYDQLVEGMKSVIDSFQDKLESSDKINVNLSSKVSEINLKEDKLEIVYNKNNEELRELYDKIIISTPAYITSTLVNKISLVSSNLLSQINYNPLAILVAKYSKDVFDKEVRAMVFDKNSTLSNAGAYGINDLNVARYTFSGMAFREKFSDKEVTKEDLIKEVQKTMSSDIFNIINNNINDSVMWYSPKALCSYSAFHYKKIDIINEELNSKNIFLTGDYIKGAAIEACFTSSKNAISKAFNK